MLGSSGNEKHFCYKHGKFYIQLNDSKRPISILIITMIEFNSFNFSRKNFYIKRFYTHSIFLFHLKRHNKLLTKNLSYCLHYSLLAHVLIYNSRVRNLSFAIICERTKRQHSNKINLDLSTSLIHFP